MVKLLLPLRFLALGMAGLASGASYSPTLDVTDVNALLTATTTALKNLIGYYTPNSVSRIPVSQFDPIHAGKVKSPHSFMK